ncbi:MAG: OmpA family protein [Bacteroidaceae bacterium]|nr:OmpA family protein [Bacteroidaceae bacterium]
MLSPSNIRRILRGPIGITLLFVVLCLFWRCGAEQNVKKGDAFFTIGEYYDAAAEYKTAYSKTPAKEKEKRGERAWKMAECYRRINYTAKAAAAYQNALRYHYPDSMVLLYLAQMQQKSGDYKNAEKNYQLFLDTVPDNQLALNGLRGCRLAPQWKNSPTLYSIKKLTTLNARRADFCPVLTGDEYEELYFTTTRPQATGDDISGISGVKSTDIFHTKLDDKQKWTTPEPCEGEINTAYEEGAICFSPDGKTMYLTRCTHDPDYPRYAEIYTSQRSDASWSKPQKLEISSDTLSSYAHPAVSPDGNWLYFVSDMPGGMGGLDIWRISIGNGLGGVENLGEPINTPGNEMFPTFRPNGDLYFSSDGHPGMGGLDLFCAVRDTVSKKTERWKIENLKYPMNSMGDDFGMTFEGVHNRGFFSSNRGDGRGWDHLYSFECPEILQTIKGWVYEKDGYELPEGLVYMVGNDGTNKKISVRGDGSFTEIIKPNVKYILLGTCKGYLNHTEEIEVDTTHESREYTLQFPLASLNTPVLVRNVFYEFDSAQLTESSTTALDSLVDLLNENPNITIELSSHCDYRGADAYNERLSQRRAESVVNYLIEHGIAQDRLQPVGYGESRPKVVTRKMAEQNAFLNVGDTLTETFIKRFEEAEIQEKCNAYNRRTEFRVLRTTYGMFDENETKESPFDGQETKPLLKKEENTTTDETILRPTEQNP